MGAILGLVTQFSAFAVTFGFIALDEGPFALAGHVALAERRTRDGSGEAVEARGVAEQRTRVHDQAVFGIGVKVEVGRFVDGFGVLEAVVVVGGGGQLLHVAEETFAGSVTRVFLAQSARKIVKKRKDNYEHVLHCCEINCRKKIDKFRSYDFKKCPGWNVFYLLFNYRCN